MVFSYCSSHSFTGEKPLPVNTVTSVESLFFCLGSVRYSLLNLVRWTNWPPLTKQILGREGELSNLMYIKPAATEDGACNGNDMETPNTEETQGGGERGSGSTSEDIRDAQVGTAGCKALPLQTALFGRSLQKEPLAARATLNEISQNLRSLTFRAIIAKGYSQSRLSSLYYYRLQF